MSRLDEIISNTAYTLDCLMALRKIYESGNCNECKIAKDCPYAPKPGQQVRYNCPGFSRAKEE